MLRRGEKKGDALISFVKPDQVMIACNVSALNLSIVQLLNLCPVIVVQWA